ncbi:uncharacterized protein LOC125527318 [Triticum urartu]|uniref:uncharacterized protein LOC125527318 n=1 Tax=Triticum urartu TaxID=4572 RepID=UPI0020449EAF|nr:uncharacterized protein LOC125527318 [Triticum urartu]
MAASSNTLEALTSSFTTWAETLGAGVHLDDRSSEATLADHGRCESRLMASICARDCCMASLPPKPGCWTMASSSPQPGSQFLQKKNDYLSILQKRRIMQKQYGETAVVGFCSTRIAWYNGFMQYCPLCNQVAARVKSDDEKDEWFVVKVIHFDKETKEFEVLDEEPGDDEESAQKFERKYKLPMSYIIPFPKKGDPSSAQDFGQGRQVLAVYPGTTALYRATVASQRKVFCYVP